MNPKRKRGIISTEVIDLVDEDDDDEQSLDDARPKKKRAFDCEGPPTAARAESPHGSLPPSHIRGRRTRADSSKLVSSSRKPARVMVPEEEIIVIEDDDNE